MSQCWLNVWPVCHTLYQQCIIWCYIPTKTNAVSVLVHRRHFQPFEVVSRYRDPQPQLVKNFDAGPTLKQHLVNAVFAGIAW